jgi:hypothetical protein
MSDTLGEKAYIQSQENKEIIETMNTSLTSIANYITVGAVANTYTLNLAAYLNFAMETTDANAKTIAFSNVPVTVGIILAVGVKLKYTNAAAITFPAGTVWKDGIIPTFVVGKKYRLIFISDDNGITWEAASIGAW